MSNSALDTVAAYGVGRFWQSDAERSGSLGLAGDGEDEEVIIEDDGSGVVTELCKLDGAMNDINVTCGAPAVGVGTQLYTRQQSSCSHQYSDKTDYKFSRFLRAAKEPATLGPTMPDTSMVAARTLSQNVVFRSPQICF